MNVLMNILLLKFMIPAHVKYSFVSSLILLCIVVTFEGFGCPEILSGLVWSVFFLLLFVSNQLPIVCYLMEAYMYHL